MVAPLDPYRVLGLPRGAPLPEVKRAYRQLAKANHPDAAGPGALPRFLAIQAAYEQLAGTAAPPLAGRAPTRPPQAWDADPIRTEATRRAYSRARRPNQDTDAGAAGGRARGRARPPGARPTGARSSGARPDPGSGAAPGPGTNARRGRGADPPGSTTQGPRGKATLGSTSYDGAEPGPFEPDWGGASWYGTTSGTYWTLNPKEYADPRKHGPEYQARARRAAGSRSGGQDQATLADDGRPASAEPIDDDWTSRANASRFRTVDDRANDAPSTSEGRPGQFGAGSGTSPYAAAGAHAADPLDVGASIWRLTSMLVDPRAGGLRGRAIRALLGWLPVALGIAWIVGEASGCSRFAATCDPSVGPLTTAGQGIVLAVLFLLPGVAALASGAALIVISVAVAASLILSATGAAADEASRRAALGGLLVAAWLSGLLISVVRRLRVGPRSTRPVS